MHVLVYVCKRKTLMKERRQYLLTLGMYMCEYVCMCVCIRVNMYVCVDAA
jgi:hypothetical protein